MQTLSLTLPLITMDFVWRRHHSTSGLYKFPSTYRAHLSPGTGEQDKNMAFGRKHWSMDERGRVEGAFIVKLAMSRIAQPGDVSTGP